MGGEDSIGPADVGHTDHVVMGVDDEEGIDDATPQQVYYGKLLHLQQFGTPEQVAEFSAGGPPPPLAADGAAGAIAFYEYHPPTAEQLNRLVAQMRAEGWITASGPRSLDRGALSDLAALKAHLVLHSNGPTPA